MAVIGNAPFQGLVSGGEILDASIEGVDLSTSAIAARLGYTPVDPGAAVFSANPTISSGTANGVAYLNGSKVVTSGSALTFDGNNLATSGKVTAAGVVLSAFATGTSGGNLELGWDGTQTVVQGYNRTTSAYVPLWLESNYTRFGIAGVEKARIHTNGNIGVGTNSPNAQLSVFNSTNGQRVARFVQQSSSTSTVGAVQIVTAQATGSALDVGHWSQQDNNYVFRAYGNVQRSEDDNVSNGSFLFGITATGKVGIGTSVPNTQLDIRFPATTPTNQLNHILLQAPSNGTTSGYGARTGITFNNRTVDYTSAGGTSTSGIYGINLDGDVYGRLMGLVFYTSNLDAAATEKLRITSNGNVGIGTTVPQSTLDVYNGTANSKVAYIASLGSYIANHGPTLVLRNGTNGGEELAGFKGAFTQSSQGNYGYLSLLTRTSDALGITEKMRITHDGNVGIGTATPGTSSKLDVIGNITIDSAFSSQFGLCFRRGFEASDNLRVYAGDVGQNRTGGLRLAAYDGVAFGTGSNDWQERARININGNFQIGTTVDAGKLTVAGKIRAYGGDIELDSGQVTTNSDVNALRLGVNGVEKANINSAGQFTAVGNIFSSGGKNVIQGFGTVYTASNIELGTTAISTFTQNSSGLTSGTYLLMISVNGSSWYSETWSGIMQWYDGGTNGGNATDIYLTGMGHANAAGQKLYARVQRTYGNTGGQNLAIWSDVTMSGVSVTIVVKRLA